MKILPICLLAILLSFSAFGQKNEITTSAAHALMHSGKALKINYDRTIYKGIGLSVGIRNQTYFWIKTWDSGSTLIRPSNYISTYYDGIKLDITPFFSPINSKQFRLKFGLGFDVGQANYHDAAKFISAQVLEHDLGRRYYAQHEIFSLCEIGYHFLIQSNYYFSNNLFVSGHVMYGEVFKTYDLIPEDYYRFLYQSNYFNLAVGIGYRF